MKQGSGRCTKGKPTSVWMMAIIQKCLLGQGMDSMDQRKMRMGSTRVIMETETMWLRMMRK